MPAKKKASAVFGLTTSQAAKLTQKNIEATIKQCEKDGKPLPASIAKIVAQIANGIPAPSVNGYAKNKRELARMIGITAPTLYDLMKKPGAPVSGDGEAKYDIVAWKQFAIRHTNPNKTNIEGDEETTRKLSEKDQALVNKQNISARRELFRLEVEMRDWVKRKEVNEAIDSANAIVARELRKAFEHVLPPQQEGMTAHEIARSNREALDEIFISLPKHLEGRLAEA